MEFFERSRNHGKTEVRGKDSSRNTLSGVRDLEHAKPSFYALPESWRIIHRAKNARRNRAH